MTPAEICPATDRSSIALLVVLDVVFDLFFGPNWPLAGVARSGGDPELGKDPDDERDPEDHPEACDEHVFDRSHWVSP